MNDDRFRALQAEWTRHPPAHWLIAHYLGYQEPEEVQHMTREAAQAFMAATGGRIDGVKKLGEP